MSFQRSTIERLKQDQATAQHNANHHHSKTDEYRAELNHHQAEAQRYALEVEDLTQLIAYAEGATAVKALDGAS